MERLIEEVRDIFPEGSEIKKHPEGRYKSLFVTVPKGEIGPLRLEKTLRRRGFDVYTGKSNNEFYVHQI